MPTKKILKWIGVPVRVGIGPTKTLAKIASYGAKKYPATNGVVDLSDKKTGEAFKITPIGEIWGVGRRLEKHLNAIGIRNAYELTQLDISYIRKRFNIVLAKTIRELKGEACIDLEDQPMTKKQIVVSRTFSRELKIKIY